MIRNFVILIVLHNSCFVYGKEILETYCNINGKYPLQRISEKFLSISIDPAVLLHGLNLSDTSLLLAEHLGPAYVRIAGPSTPVVEYDDNEGESQNSLPTHGNNVVMMPSMWFGINEWLKLANLAPVPDINGVKVAGGNSKSTSLLEISDKLNVSCYWMLGFDSSKKSDSQFYNDPSLFQDILRSLADKNNPWKTDDPFIDNSKCASKDLKDIVTTVTWDLNSNESLPKKDRSLKVFKAPVKFWTVSPSPEPVSFYSTVLWAEQVGNAAKFGYDMVFRQPKMHDTFADTPGYWFSLLHKKLIAKSVLETKPLTHHMGSSVFAYCTKEQNNFKARGALTVMIVNSNQQSYKVRINLEKLPWRRLTEVHSYILTSINRNSTDSYLNGKKLTPGLLLEQHPFRPDITIKKSKSHVSLKVPPMSIGFFVLPKAKAPACMSEEKQRNVPHQETNTVEKTPISEAVTLQLRGSFNEAKNKRKKEFKSEERYLKSSPRSNFLNKRTETSSVENDQYENNLWDAEYRKQLLKRRAELRKSIFGKYKKRSKAQVKPRSGYLDLTSEETERILKDRARTRAAQRKVYLSEDELDIIVEAVRRTFLKPKHKRLIPPAEIEIRENGITKMKPLRKQFRRSLRKRRDVNMKLLNFRAKLEENRQRLETKMSDVVGNAQSLKQNIAERIRKLKHKNHRFKRDINMELLKQKTEGYKKKARELMKKHSKNKEKKHTLRKSSEELSDERSSSVERSVPKIRFFTESATSEESGQEDVDSSSKEKKPKKLSLLEKIKKLVTAKPITDSSKTKYKKEDSEEVENSLAFLTASDEFNDIGGELPCISEHFGSPNKKTKEDSPVGKIHKKIHGKDDFKKGRTRDSMEYLRRKRSISPYEDVQELGAVEISMGDDNSNDEADLTPKNFRKRSAADCLESYQDQFDNYQYGKLQGNHVKRNAEDPTEDEVPGEKNKPTLKVTFAQRLKDLLEAREINKLKLEEVISKNKPKLPTLGIKKNEEDQEQAPKVGDKKEELAERLKLFKEKLTYKLKDIGKVLKNGTKLQNDSEEEDSNTSEDCKGDRTSPKCKTKNVNANLSPGNVMDDVNEPSQPVDVAKRSLFDQEYQDFGSYRPLTPDLRDWKPSDILSLNSLKRDENFDTASKLTPINDILMFRNVIIPNTYSEVRRKRSNKNNLDYLDKDTYMNEIDKDSMYMIPKMRTEHEGYRVTADDAKNEDISEKSLELNGLESEMEKGSFASIEGTENRSDSDKEISVPTADNVTVTNRLSDNIQKIPTKEEKTTIDTFINKISGFFSKIGLALKHYF